MERPTAARLLLLAGIAACVVGLKGLPAKPASTSR
jgi:hypothetical protein